MRRSGDMTNIVRRVNETSSADFVKRLKDANRQVLRNNDGSVSTHELGYVTSGDKAIVFPSVQSSGDTLARFEYPASLDRAIERGDTLVMSIPDAEKFTTQYKDYYPGFNQYNSGGSIHIKPENRGKFTALKKRTGHSASWFKAHGTPAQKKMAVFALNARKWKHGDGGWLEQPDEAVMNEYMDTARGMYDYMLSQGMSTNEAAMITGKILYESGGDPYNTYGGGGLLVGYGLRNNMFDDNVERARQRQLDTIIGFAGEQGISYDAQDKLNADIIKDYFADGGELDNDEYAVEDMAMWPGDTIDFSSIATTRLRPYNADYIAYINKALKKNGSLNDYQRASILANIIEESGGDPFSVSPDGKFYGLLQWDNRRYVPSGETDAYREIDNQVSHILDTIHNLSDSKSWTDGGKGTGYMSLVDAYKDFNAYDLDKTMRGVTLGYVRPSGKMDSYNNRLKVARQLMNITGFSKGDMPKLLSNRFAEGGPVGSREISEGRTSVV